MTMDRTLKISGGLTGTRSVLTRAERIKQLTEEGKFDPDKNSALGLPKVKVRHSRAGHKAKKEEVAEGAEAVPGAVPPAGAAPAGKAAAKAAPAGKVAAKAAPAAKGAKAPAAKPEAKKK